MRSQPEYDVALVGGGCAGLSLAVALAERDPQQRIAVVEPRERFPRDRTWCYWDVASQPFEDAVPHSRPPWRSFQRRQEWATASSKGWL